MIYKSYLLEQNIEGLIKNNIFYSMVKMMDLKNEFKKKSD